MADYQELAGLKKIARIITMPVIKIQTQAKMSP